MIKRKPIRLPGHALTIEWSGERGAQSSSTGYCKCGKWQESHSAQWGVRQEYRWHLERVLELAQSASEQADDNEEGA